MLNKRQVYPIYTSRGDLGAYLSYPYIFNQLGEWIGWVTRDRDVYSVLGHYVGWLSKDPRILRKRAYDFSMPRLQPPEPPERVMPPATVPLAPMMPEIPYTIIDILHEEPDRLQTADFDELREDMD